MNVAQSSGFVRPSTFALGASADRSRLDRRLLAVVLAGGALLRAWLAFARPLAIEAEGAEYAAIARNLLAGEGYVGTFEGGTQLLFPPLYPGLIAAASLFTGDFEIAGRVVSLVAGALLPVPVVLIARSLYGERVALLAGALVAFSPLLALLSSSVYSEAPFLTLLATAVWFSLRCLQWERWRDPVLAGVCFGLAYLARPEAMLYPPIVAVLLVLHAFHQPVPRWRRVLFPSAVVGAFVLVAAPYVAFLSAACGTFRLEGKGAINCVMSERMNAGLSYVDACYGLSADLRTAGPILNANAFIRSSGAHAWTATRARDMVTNSARRNAGPLYHKLLSAPFGGPLLLALVTLGFFSQPWSSDRLVKDLMLMSVVAAMLAVLLLMNGLLNRYFFPLLPFLMIWTAKGIDEFARWLGRTVRLFAIVSPGLDRFVVTATRLLIVAAFLGVSLAGARSLSEFASGRSSHLAASAAGRWLAQQPDGARRIFDVDPVIPYYAGGTLLCLPSAPADVALRYIESRQPDFIVLKGRLAGRWAFMDDWLAHGIPSSRATLVYETGATARDRVQIYRWRRE